MIVSFYKLLRPWAERQATYNQASTGQNWQQPLAAGPADRNRRPSPPPVYLPAAG
ncbi:MAG: hypothetical protein KIS63_02430 [Caldilineales bacterium]|nr:hypothetical protein [Caldilineales bacterium]